MKSLDDLDAMQATNTRTVDVGLLERALAALETLHNDDALRLFFKAALGIGYGKAMDAMPLGGGRNMEDAIRTARMGADIAFTERQREILEDEIEAARKL